MSIKCRICLGPKQKYQAVCDRCERNFKDQEFTEDDETFVDCDVHDYMRAKEDPNDE